MFLEYIKREIPRKRVNNGKLEIECYNIAAKLLILHLIDTLEQFIRKNCSPNLLPVPQQTRVEASSYF